MPKPSDYTPTRRYIMQGVMMLILGASVALAATVVSSARRGNRVELSPERVTRRDVTVRLPQGWQVRKDNKDPALVVEAVEAASSQDDDADEARTITVRLERLPAPASTLQYLFSNHELPAPDSRQRGGRMREDWLMSIPIAGRSGIMMTAEHGTRRRGRGSTLRKEVIATVVLPSLRAVVVHLEGMGEADANDHAVVKQIAGAITVGNEPELGKPGEVVTLVDGIRFTAPSGFAPVPESDTSRTDRRLWPAAIAGKSTGELESRWQSIEVVGCLCPDFDASDPKQVERAKSTLATLLLVRDPRLRDGTVTSLGNKVWRADPPKTEDGQDLPVRAYLMTDPSGRALLAVVYGGLGRTDFDSTWNDLAASVRFLPAADVASLKDVGTTEAARLRRTGYETLLADRDVQWWLWTRDDAYIGWSSTDFTGRALVGKKEGRLRLDHGQHVSRVTHDFSYSDQGPRYESTVVREQTGPDDERLQSTQRTTLADGKLSMSYKHATGATTQLAAGDPPPPQFVPGALVPLVLGQLARDPMLLMTDSFPSCEGIGPAQLLTLVIRPGDNTTRTAEGEAAPMRCVNVQVNGVGAVSRWYFRQSGELETVEWPGGIRQSVSDEKVVKNNFPKDDP